MQWKLESAQLPRYNLPSVRNLDHLPIIKPRAPHAMALAQIGNRAEMRNIQTIQSLQKSSQLKHPL